MIQVSTDNRVDQLARFRLTLRTLKLNCDTWVNELATRSMDYTRVVQLAKSLYDYREYFAGYLASNLDYVNSEQGADVTADMTAIRDNINTIIAGVRSTIPLTADGYVKERKLEANGVLATDTLSPAQSGSLRTVLQNISSLIG